MSICKPIDELTIEDLKQNPIWEWAIDEEENEEYDETWVKPALTFYRRVIWFNSTWRINFT